MEVDNLKLGLWMMSTIPLKYVTDNMKRSLIFPKKVFTLKDFGLKVLNGLRIILMNLMIKLLIPHYQFYILELKKLKTRDMVIWINQINIIVLFISIKEELIYIKLLLCILTVKALDKDLLIGKREVFVFFVLMIDLSLYFIYLFKLIKNP